MDNNNFTNNDYNNNYSNNNNNNNGFTGDQSSTPSNQDTSSQPYNSSSQNTGYTGYNNYTNPYTAPHQQQNAYQSYQRPPKVKRPKNSNSFGVKLGKCAAIAAVFGLVSGTVFTGVNYVGNRALGIPEAAASTDQEADSVEASNIKQTSLGYAKDLVDVSGIVDEVMPSIVAITNTATVTYQSFWGQTYTEDSESCGSGIIIDKDDEYLYIASNNHVVAGAETLKVQFADKSIVEAQVRGTYAASDLAVVMVKLSDIEKDTLSNIKIAAIADTTDLSVGEASIAIGNALGYGQSVTTGVISALGRSVTTQDETTGQTITNSNLIQTDAAINPGNSGGALLNAAGEVIGINSVKYASTEVEGIGYAIPMSSAMPIIEKLISDGDYVNENTGYLGISGKDVSPEVAQVYDIPQGAYVIEVAKGSGAEAAGIQQGDIITALNGTPVTNMTELQAALVTYSAGDEVTVTVARQQGKGYVENDVQVTLSTAKVMKSNQ